MICRFAILHRSKSTSSGGGAGFLGPCFSFPGFGALLPLVLLAGACPLAAWSPGTGQPGAVDGFVVDPTNRTDVLAFYQTVYTASENYAANLAWTGNVVTGTAGTTSAAFQGDVLRRINFYRALSGLPADITLDAAKSAKDQEAALMFARNGMLSHFPPADWFFYTANGAQAAGASNIALGNYGPGAVNAFMRDDGSNNILVGHRRWLHYSRARVMGTGDVPAQSPYNSANAIWVIGDFKTAPAPQFSAWPNRGYVPFTLVPARWSLSYPQADFSGASVTMTQGNASVAAPIISSDDTGYADNTLVWTPAGLPGSIDSDRPYTVTVSGIRGSGIPTNYSYSVTLFDPTVLGDAVTIAGSSSPAVTGAPYAFNSIAQADAYELLVTTGSTTAWTEGAEDAPLPQISQTTTGTNPLRQSATFRTGSKAFQLVFPTFNDQSFVITRDIIPTASSTLQFYDLCRFATTTSTLSAEVSINGSSTWTGVWQRPGVGLNSALWDPAFISRSVSLSAYAGQILRVRFILRRNGQSINLGTTSNHGFFIDDVTVTNATQLVNPGVTSLARTATSFTLNSATAGAPLTAGTSYFLRIRPNVGTQWFPYGPAKIVTAARFATGYAAWVAAQYPVVTGGPTDDHERDGLANGVEYAFGLNPTIANPGSALPQPIHAGTTYSVSFSQPNGVTGVTYAAQWSPNLATWNPITDTGSGNTHTFSINTSGKPTLYFRYHITTAP